MEEGFLVSRRAISLAKQFLEASFDVVALQETHTRLAGTIRLPGYTDTSTDAGPKPFTVHNYGVARLPQIAASMVQGFMIALPSSTNRSLPFSRTLRILAVSATSTTGQKLLLVTFHASPVDRPHAETHT